MQELNEEKYPLSNLKCVILVCSLYIQDHDTILISKLLSASAIDTRKHANKSNAGASFALT